MANIFANVKTVNELLVEYEKAREIKEMPLEQIENDCHERLQQLMSVGVSLTSTSTDAFNENAKIRPVKFNENSADKPISVKKNKNRPYEFFGVRGNASFPSATPHVDEVVRDTSRGYTSVPSAVVDYAFVESGMYFKDYLPFIDNGKLVLHVLDRASYYIMVENSLRLNAEDGIHGELRKAYYCKNELYNKDMGNGNSITFVWTYLTEKEKVMLDYRLLTMYAVYDNYIVQIPFTIG